MAKGLARTQVYPIAVVQELGQLETDLGGRQAVVGMLTLAPLNDDLRYILGLLGDPRQENKSLAEVCALGNILPSELLRHLSGAALLRGKVLASQKIGSGIAAVAEDVMRRAAPYEEMCPTCMVDGQATGRITPNPTPAMMNPQPEPCPDCRGSLKLRYQPTLDRQKLAIEMAQLLPKSSGLQILNQQFANGVVGASGGGGPIEKLQALTDRLLYGTGPTAPTPDADPDEVDDPAEVIDALPLEP